MHSQNWIKDALKDAGLKMKDLAAALKITSPRVTDILQGKRSVQAHELLPLATLLGMGVKSLLASLDAGKRVLVAGDGPSATLPILGHLTGHGTVVPLADTAPLKAIPLPAGAETADGLYCYIMGDSSMAGEIKAGDIVIAADPRKHFYPMVPGAIFLVSGPDGSLAPRQFMKADSGESWLVALPEHPDPSLASWRFDMLPESLTAERSAETGAKTGRTVYTADIFAAVLWVHRSYIAATTA
ncbi:helix-turn-helix domain-containing protein [Kordiimonas pumila]|uniref:Helix-turn-helix domain-containing protein n=1 Tax=Kordiimonas pumila TaxID=2161677 RepID=A0ABV7D4H8_9PROT